MRLASLLILAIIATSSCAPPPQPAEVPRAAPTPEEIAAVLDDLHDAAANSDEARYFSHFADDGVFLGTDAKERWDVSAFRAYAHPYFAKGKAWSFKAVRRAVTFDTALDVAWFDEDLETRNLGPARGSGVVVRRGKEWKISQYNLAITVPNERFSDVKRAVEGGMAPAPSLAVSAGGTIHGAVKLTGNAPKMRVPRLRRDAEYCKLHPIKHNAVVVNEEGALADVFVRIASTSIGGRFIVPSSPLAIHSRDCVYLPRVVAAVRGQTLEVHNDGGTLLNLHFYRGSGETWTNQAQPKGASPSVRELDDVGILTLTSDVHPWMKSFIVVSDHPFFAVSGVDGSFAIDGVPRGRYTLEAWHSMYGWKRVEVDVEEGKTAAIDLAYTGTEPAPPENPQELKDLF